MSKRFVINIKNLNTKQNMNTKIILTYAQIESSENILPNYPPQQQYSETPSHNRETHFKPELAEDDFNFRKVGHLK